MITNHWGKWVDSNIPTTGVINSNEVAWEWLSDDICLTCDESIREINNDPELSEDEKQEELEFLECDSSHTRLIGDWILDTNTNKYDIDKNGDFSAIENESTVQIVFSKYIKHNCALCSPCYPGQVDLDSRGSFQGFSLPEYLLPDGFNTQFEESPHD